jgi:hypothetical protein
MNGFDLAEIIAPFVRIVSRRDVVPQYAKRNVRDWQCNRDD